MSGVVRIHTEEGGNSIELETLRNTVPVAEEVKQPLAQLGDDIIVCDNIHKTYLLGMEGVPALRGVSLRIRKGEFICILGKSGGGKTSLLNCIGTIDKVTKGELHLCGRVVKETTTDEEFADLRLRKIGFVFQTFNLIASMTALENVSLPMVLDGSKSSAEIKARATMLLESVGMGDRTDHLPSQLSGGEQQRVTIARAISNKPKILLLDEPTGDLDTHNSNIILNLLLQLNRVEGITCVMVTHDRALKNFSHRTVHMIDGKINYIEEISQSVRQETDRQLREDIANKNHRNATATAEVTTEVRDVAHYAHGACRPLPPL